MAFPGRSRALAFAATAAVIAPAVANAQSVNILSPTDAVIAIDGNRNRPGDTNTGGEGPASAFDGNDGTKWLSFGRSFTGLVFTPTTPNSVAKSLTFTTGGDASARDPVRYQLFGTNGPVNAVDNGNGLENPWTFIAGGATNIAASNLPATPRSTTAAPVNFTNAAAFNAYKVVFTKLRAANDGVFDPVTLANGDTPNSVQVGEVRLFDQPNGVGTNLALQPTSAVAFDQTDSYFPAGERPVEAIDGNKSASSKYLNFGREGSGLIVTPARGATIVTSLQVTTANDAEARDPTTYELYGTNSPIASIEDSEGTGEPWTPITAGSLTLPADRNAAGGVVGFANGNAYLSYKIVFTDNKGPDDQADSIQFSELELFGTTAIPEPATVGLLGTTAVGLLASGRRRSGR